LAFLNGEIPFKKPAPQTSLCGALFTLSMQTIGTNIWRTSAGKPGQHVIVLGGVHGNELTGIRVVNDLVSAFSGGEAALAAGTLTLALGNPEAIRLGLRATEPYADLNRSFTPEKIAGRSTYEEVRAAELAPIITEADVLIDIHATNRPSKPFVVATDHDQRRTALAARFPCDAFLVSPDEIIGGTTDGWVSRCGGYGIGFESGLASDVTRVRSTKDAVIAALGDLGLLPPDAGGKPCLAKDVICLTSAVTFHGGSFEFAPGKGLASFEPFKKGELLAILDDEPIVAPHDGLLMFPKPEHLRRPGLPAAFLAQKTASSASRGG
jgi:succinylglutamate desuccinylase